MRIGRKARILVSLALFGLVLLVSTSYWGSQPVVANAVTKQLVDSQSTDLSVTGPLFAADATAASLLRDQQGCSQSNPGKITVTFSWTPAGMGEQWLDLSLYNNDFAAGTFVGSGPLSPGANTLVWDGIEPGRVHFARVNTLTASGWQSSPTYSFLTGSCTTIDGSSTSPVFYQQVCSAENPGQIAMIFRWQPIGEGVQWLDISLFGNDFAAGTFSSWGPWPAETSTATWNGILPGRTHYFRINTASLAGWKTSKTVMFTTGTCSAGARWPTVKLIDWGSNILLTFDDCGNPYSGTVRILDILKEKRVRAIFFPTGACIGMAPDVFDRVIAEGHLIGNHTWNHDNLTTKSLDGVYQEIAGGPTQAQGGFWRPPEGATNDTINAIAAELGYTLMMWTLDSNDTHQVQNPDGTYGLAHADYIYDRVTSLARPGDIVLMHVHKDTSISVLPAIIDALRAKGYTVGW